MSVDIEKLRALCDRVPSPLTVDHRGSVVVGVGGEPAPRTGMRPAGDPFPCMLRPAREYAPQLATAELAAEARSAIPDLCDEVEQLRAEVARLRAQREAVGELLATNGCDCDCGHDHEGHDGDCDRCLGCRIGMVL